MELEHSNTPDISQSHTYIINSGIDIENFLNGNPDDIRYFIFGFDTIVESNSNIKLQGGENFYGRIGDTLTLLFDGDDWLELSRSLNPMYSGGTLDAYSLDSGYIEQEIMAIKERQSAIQDQINYLTNMVDGIITDVFININPGMTREVIQNEIENVVHRVNKGAAIWIIFEVGNYVFDESILIRNFRGDGTLHVIGNNTEFDMTTSKTVVIDGTSSNQSLFKIVNNTIPIIFNGLQMQYHNLQTVEDSGCINILNSSVDVLNSVLMTDATIGQGVYFNNSNGIVKNTYVSNGNSGIYADNRSHILIDNCDDNATKPQYGIVSSNGATISLINNQQPDGIVSDTMKTSGGTITA